MKDWYLITRPSTTSGGFEDESFNNYKEDLLGDILDTELAVSAVRYNYDLSEMEEIRIVTQGNLADTYLKSVNRTVIAPVGTFHAGDYIYFEDEYWLVTGRPGNNKFYEKVVVVLCQDKVKWQKDDGGIVERWAHFTSASKYDVGEGGTSMMFLASNNFTILMPNDDDAMTIEDKRVFIDKNILPTKVFKITRNDDILYNYHSHGGVIGLIADRDEFNIDTDNQELRLCDYKAPILPPDPDPETGDVEWDLYIEYRGRNTIIAGGNEKRFSCYGLASDGQTVDLRSLRWSVTTMEENANFISYVINDDNSISVKCEYDPSIIGTQILITATVYDHSDSLYVDIGGGV